MTTPKRIRRPRLPRLERRQGHEISAETVFNAGIIIERRVRDTTQSLGVTQMKDLKRLAKFLPRAIAYLESRRGKGAR